jgi:phosphatidylserine/phosphatidylglycerophosphate/cardiolipin synthase-like enzyme
MKLFQTMPPADLERLSTALRTRRLSPPYSAVSVGRACPTANRGLLCAELCRLEAAGWSAVQIADLAEAVSTASSARQAAVELVWSGPEGDGLTNRDTGVVTRELFGQAASEVVVVGFAVYQGREIFARLADRLMELPTLKVRLFLDVRRPGGSSLPADQLARQFATEFLRTEWPSAVPPEMFYDPRSLNSEGAVRSSLHAKCVVIDRSMSLVTSANFTEAAQQRNIEVGCLIRCKRFASQLVGHFDKLLETGAIKKIGA